MPILTHLEAVLRGWYPHFVAQVSGWSAQTIVLWTALLFAFLRTLRTLYSK
jgi:hypothetical protein